MTRRLLLEAQDFQPSDDPALTFAEQRERAIERAIMDGLLTMQEAIDSEELRRKIMARDTSGTAAIFLIPRVRDALQAAYQPIADTFIAAAEQEAEEKFGGLVVYDPLAAAAELAGARQNFMGSVLGPSSQSVVDQLVSALRNGADPAEVADTLRAVIPLTPRQAQAVMNFRRLLVEGNREALRRALRDKRFDATVEAWIEGRAPVDPAKVDAMVARYAEKALAQRARTIARTESLQATVGGIRSAYKQAVDSGRLYDSEVRRRWLVTPDERLCAVCASIPLLNPREGIGVNEPYESIKGPIMAPLAHPNCRCTEVYRADLGRVISNPFAAAA